MGLSSMIVRAMADILITMKWLVERADSASYAKYKEFSLGKRKLLKLHVEDLVDSGREYLRPFEESLAEMINEEIWEELLIVDLGNSFSGKSPHQMAKEVGLSELYNLVYSPSSSDLHSEWTCLTTMHLARCKNPLHRFHRLPQLDANASISSYGVMQAANILRQSLDAWAQAYGIPLGADELVRMSELVDSAFQNFSTHEPS